MSNKSTTFQLIPLAVIFGLLNLLLTHSIEGGMNGFQGYLLGFVGTLIFVATIGFLSDLFKIRDLEERRNAFDILLKKYEQQLKSEGRQDLLLKIDALRHKGSTLK